LTNQIALLLQKAQPATVKPQNFTRLCRHLVSQLVCFGRHTLTGLISTGGRMFEDWSADYRLYSKERIDIEGIFKSIFKEVMQHGNTKEPLVAALDDSVLRKNGKKIPGVKYTRDPMGPPFQVNFVRGQRVIQLSAAVTENGKAARMIPVVFRSAPSADKPKHNAKPEEWDKYKEVQKQKNLSRHGLACIKDVRKQMDDNGASERALWLSVDGSYTNKTIMQNLPDRVTLIGRIREDAKLSYIPNSEATQLTGRKLVYGTDAPTPKALCQNDEIPWQIAEAFVAGRTHTFRIKTLKPLRWRIAGAKHQLQLIVIAPLRYRLSKQARLLYRKAAYLVCTDANADPVKILQAYLWRWDIEVNFRDEKTLLGVGQAQVWNNASTNLVPQMMVAAYSLLLMASIQTFGITGMPVMLPDPKWRTKKKKQRASTMDLIKQLRAELWAEAIDDKCFSDFVISQTNNTNCEKVAIPAKSAIFYAVA
jgi:hypothetical protein